MKSTTLTQVGPIVYGTPNVIISYRRTPAPRLPEVVLYKDVTNGKTSIAAEANM